MNINNTKLIIRTGVRRVFRINYSRAITLPKEWLESVGIDVGDLIEVKTDGDTKLLIKPLKRGARYGQ